jgi:DNA polymerase-3 subunit epsilon
MDWRKLWRRAARPDPRRWIVLDVEASGLDAARDRLLAIAAVALQVEPGQTPRIGLGDSFEVVLRHDDAPVDKANILLHGIGVGAQREGADTPAALAAFERWVGAAPLIGFHVAFDRTLIQRAMQGALGRVLPNPWLDLEPVAAVLRPDVPARSLDEWLAALDVRCAVRHQAAADALATAELLQRLWPAIAATGASDFAALQRLAGQRRWLAR